MSDLQTYSSTSFLSDLKKSITRSSENDAFIFIHGYNTTFKQAALRTAQLAFDLKFLGAAILYSWPSEGDPLNYHPDEENALWTVPHLVEVLRKVSEGGARRIHLIAHSMGSRAVVNALDEIRREPGKGKLSLRELVFAAPDIDVEIFARFAGTFAASAKRTTLYACSDDEALKASQRFSHHRRAGQSGGQTLVMPGVETIDATEIETGFLNHSYFSRRSVVEDMYTMFHEDMPPRRAPDDRPGVRKSARGDFWMFAR